MISPERGAIRESGVHLFAATVLAASLSPIHSRAIEREQAVPDPQQLGQLALKSHTVINGPSFSSVAKSHLEHSTETTNSPTTTTTRLSPVSTTTAPPKLSLAQQAAKKVTPQMFAEWSKTNVCEEGGNWHVIGPYFSGGLGISNANWVTYGGLKYAPNGGLATPDEQILIARHIQLNPPDQNGCDGDW